MEEINIKFVSNNDEVIIKCKRKEKMEEIFNKYKKQTKKENRNLEFLYDGKKLDGGLKLENVKILDNQIIIVRDKIQIKSSLSPAPLSGIKEIKHSKDIICPICKESCIISFHGYKFTLNNCNIKEHNTENKLLSDYDKTQIIEEKKLCNQCLNKNSNLNNNKFYHCLTCKMNLCPLCKANHDDNHIIVDQRLVNYKCKPHGKSYISYCELCEINLCNLCKNEHNIMHNIIDYDELKPDYDVRQKLNEL